MPQWPRPEPRNFYQQLRGNRPIPSGSVLLLDDDLAPANHAVVAEPLELVVEALGDVVLVRAWPTRGLDAMCARGTPDPPPLTRRPARLE